VGGAKKPSYTRSKVTDNPFGISRRWNWTLIHLGRPQELISLQIEALERKLALGAANEKIVSQL